MSRGLGDVYKRQPFLWTYMMNGFILQENTSILISRNGKNIV
ncbi:hypothetical protein JMUB7526_28770 [Staphylococcus aureus]